MSLSVDGKEKKVKCRLIVLQVRSKSVKTKIHPATSSLLRKPTINPINQVRSSIQPFHQSAETNPTESSAGSMVKPLSCTPTQQPVIHQDKINHRLMKPPLGNFFFQLSFFFQFSFDF